VPITIADVGARAKVSKTTMSRVLNGKGELNESTAVRVRKVIEEMGYVPSPRPVDLARGRNRVVGMLIPLTWPWIGEVVQDAVDVLETERYGLLLFTFNRGDESLRQFGAQVSAKSFDGLLVIEPEGTLDYITMLPARGLPVVLIDDRDVQPGQIPSVGTTSHIGAGATAQHLLSLSRDKALVIAGSERFGCTIQRLDGFTSAYAEAGLQGAAQRVLPGDVTIACGFDGVQRRSRPGWTPTRPSSTTTCPPPGDVGGARQRTPDPAGRRDVGFDDIPMAPHLAATHHRAPTVARDGRGRGTHAARLLRGPLSNRPPSYRQRSRSAPPPRAHNRHHPALRRGTPSPDFRST
jgi:LacI family transcriptional regulator